MVRISWTEQALDDMDNIAEFIAQDSLSYAKIQVQRFFDNVELLRTTPKIGRVVPEIGDENIREIIQGNYRIIYKIVTAREIDILTFHHSNRLFSNNPALEDQNTP